jgi:hypothetical protein
MQESEIKGVVAEIAVLGSLGFQVNSQTEQYTLRTIPGEFSGLQLLCIEYVGFRLIGHSVDIGFDIAAEYEAARRLFEQQT